MQINIFMNTIKKRKLNKKLLSLTENYKYNILHN